ncbi:MAG: PIN domain-containing protein [Kiritimatiellia bacterium]
MSAVRFLDTNVLLYAYDLDAPAKRAVALKVVEEGWIRPGSAAVSVQVLQEFHVNLTRKGLSREEASKVAESYLAWPVVENTAVLFRNGCEVQARWQLSLWDAMILAAAQAAGAKELWSEDLNPGQKYGSVRVVNPFVDF